MENGDMYTEIARLVSNTIFGIGILWTIATFFKGIFGGFERSGEGCKCKPVDVEALKKSLIKSMKGEVQRCVLREFELREGKEAQKKVSIWYMRDNHTFLRITAVSWVELVEEVYKAGISSPCGMCSVRILAADGTDLVLESYEPIHHDYKLEDAEWRREVEAWVGKLSLDEELNRLLPMNKED